MIKQFTERAALVSPPGLASIHSVECLVEEEPNRPAGVYPRRAVLIQRWRIPEHGEKINDNKTEARERNLYSDVSASAKCVGMNRWKRASRKIKAFRIGLTRLGLRQVSIVDIESAGRLTPST
jgi:hypothetical protein